MSFSTLGLKPKPKDSTKGAEAIKPTAAFKVTDRLKPKTVDLVTKINFKLKLIIK